MSKTDTAIKGQSIYSYQRSL